MTSLFRFFESAVDLQNVFYSFIVALIASIILALIVGSRLDLRGAVVTFMLSWAIMLSGYFIVRGKVHEYRLREIKAVMSSIDQTKVRKGAPQTAVITSWEKGLELIRKNPSEIGLYLDTVPYFEKDKDYESAATLIEYGLDFIDYQQVPIVLCDKLQFYYQNMPNSNRPKIGPGCVKIHDLP